MSSASQAGSEVSILPHHLIIPAPNAPRNCNKRPRQLEPPSSPGRPAGIRRPAEHPQTAGHVRDQSPTIESVLQLPRAASEVPLRLGSFRPGSPRFCPAGGRAPAVPPQPEKLICRVYKQHCSGDSHQQPRYQRQTGFSSWKRQKKKKKKKKKNKKN